MKIKSTQLKAGMKIRVSYSDQDEEYEFLGYTNHEDQYGDSKKVVFQSTKELLSHYGVKSLKALEELQNQNQYGFCSYMVVRDCAGEVGSWFYLYKGRWSIGSGADPLSFELIDNEFEKPAAPLADSKPRVRPVVKLVGEDGNAFAILGRVSKALKNAGMVVEAKEFMKEAIAGDYDHLLRTCMKYVDAK